MKLEGMRRCGFYRRVVRDGGQGAGEDAIPQDEVKRAAMLLQRADYLRLAMEQHPFDNDIRADERAALVWALGELFGEETVDEWLAACLAPDDGATNGGGRLPRLVYGEDGTS